MNTKPVKRQAGRPPGTKNKPSKIKIKNKKLLLQTLEKEHGILGPALKVAGISRSTFNNYYNQDPEFRLVIDEIREGAIDFVESELVNQIKAKNTTATIFYLKCKGREHGWIDQQDMRIEASSEIKIKYIVPEEEPKKLNQNNLDITQPIVVSVKNN